MSGSYSEQSEYVQTFSEPGPAAQRPHPLTNVRF